jgi:hypothetical protein
MMMMMMMMFKVAMMDPPLFKLWVADQNDGHIQLDV